MIRKLTALCLLVSFIALASSGLLMLVVDRPSFTLRLHPVHKLFGLVLVAAAGVHLALNARALRQHLRDGRVQVAGVVLAVVLAATYAAAALRPLDEATAQQLDNAAQRLEAGPASR
ncbi:hypothetical protein DBR42_21090 [Pelomonas sp. HMWF004]|nr:hypothetical protein DBR42_21090 [Pelomonas sp. HMWF004]